MEKLIVRVEVDGVELEPIDMGEGREDTTYKGDIKFYSMGHVFNKDHTHAPYEYMISLTRHKSEEEGGDR